MTTVESPALEQAAFLKAVSSHLAEYHHLPPVNIAWEDLQLRERGAQGVLTWAKTLTDPVVSIKTVADWTNVRVNGSVGGHRLKVWTPDTGDISRWVEPGEFTVTTIALDQLEAYVATGTVDGIKR